MGSIKKFEPGRLPVRCSILHYWALTYGTANNANPATMLSLPYPLCDRTANSCDGKANFMDKSQIIRESFRQLPEDLHDNSG
jgi:hypothetical protein